MEENVIYVIYIIINLMTTISWRAYHKKNFYNYDKREKLEDFADKIFPFFWKNGMTNVRLIFLVRTMNGFAKTGVTVPTGQ